MTDKRGMVLLRTWVEFLFTAVLVVGFLLAFSLKSAVLVYIFSALSGITTGYMLAERKKHLPPYVILLGFLIGYTLGARYGSWKVTLFLYLLGIAVSMVERKKGWLGV